MIVKIENLEQEKYVLECAEKDYFVWTGGGEDPTEWTPSKGGHSFPFNIDYCDMLMVINLKDSNTTFEQFKAKREEPIKTNLEKEYTEEERRAQKWLDETDFKQFSQMELLVMFQADKEKENEELKEVCKDALVFLLKEEESSKTLFQITDKMKQLTQTPSQTEANEIIKNASPEVLEELKKLL